VAEVADGVMRRWSAVIRTADEAEYVRYVEETGIGDYAATPGNRGFQLLLRSLGDGRSEVTTLSWWDSMEAVTAFAGADAAKARYYPEDDRFLLTKPETVEHFRVVLGQAPKPA
jgi:heme-degrading monooxygenase HmoA